MAKKNIDKHQNTQGTGNPTYKRGDQFYNPKTKRQFVYDGPDEIVKGGHNLISDQGHIFLTYMDELESGTGPGRNPLDYDVVKKYNDTLTEMGVLAADRDKLQYKDPDKYFEQLQNNINDLKRYEREVKKQIKNHRMDTDDYNKMKYLQSQIDRYYKNNPDKQIKQQVESEIKATEDSKNVSQFTDEEITKPQIESKTVGETLENTTENVLEETVETVGETMTKEVIEEGTEKVVKEVLGVNVELDGFNKKRAPKKLKKGTEKLKNKTGKNVSKRRQKYEKKQQQRQQKKQKEFVDNTMHIDDEIDLDELNKQWYESKQKEFEQKQKEIDDYFKNNADIDPKDVLKDDYEPDVNKFTDDIDTLGKNFEQSKDFDINKGVDEALDAVNKTVETTRDGGSISKYLKEFSNMGFFDKVQTIGAAAGAISEYKNARRQGHGVVSSTIRAGVDFALGEAMGMYYPLFLGAKALPGAIVKGSEMLYKENRKMNSMANQQIFGDAQFQDTQQLATMRQSGMEMAKMAQYNLQQTLMGNEATYFHR